MQKLWRKLGKWKKTKNQKKKNLFLCKIFQGCHHGKSMTGVGAGEGLRLLCGYKDEEERGPLSRTEYSVLVDML